MGKHVFHSLSVCAGCECSGDDFGTVNVEAFELTGELYCEECADEAIAQWADDHPVEAVRDMLTASLASLQPKDQGNG